MTKRFSCVLACLVACLIVVNVASAQKKEHEGHKHEGKKRGSAEQFFKEMGSKDGKVLLKADFLAAAKTKGKDEDRAQTFWRKFAGDKDSITIEEFKEKWEQRAAEGRKHEGGKKHEKRESK